MEKAGIVKIILLIIGFIVLVTTVTLAFIFLPDDTPPPKYSLYTVILPDNVKDMDYPHYTASGKIVFQYQSTTDNQYYTAVINDDGTHLHNIYKGELKPFYNNTNGVRLMPFKDNKRILIGDSILECDPDLDQADITKTKLIPIEYPDEVVGMKDIALLWSEIVPSPDNVHMGWTTLANFGAAVFISRLERQENTEGLPDFISPEIDLSQNPGARNDIKYVMKNVQLISDVSYFDNDPDHEGEIILPSFIHGGEIKQITWDCQKASFVGATFDGMSRSVLQDLSKDNVQAITHEAGYDETTIISPNQKLGIVMTSRFSPKTSCSILGLVPRPKSALGMMLFTQSAYTYSITGVRFTREGNIGPALIDLEQSMNDNDINRQYHGFDLHDTKGYEFRSPISWHPSSTKAIWLEMKKNQVNATRIRQIVLDQDAFPPGEPVQCTSETPDNIPYALDLSALVNMSFKMVSGKIVSPLGKDKGGYIDYTNFGIKSSMKYNNYSEDGVYFYEGNEEFNDDKQKGIQSYTGKVDMFKSNQGNREKVGEMDFKLSFIGTGENLKLFRDESYGYATYNGVTSKVDDMED